MANTSDPASRRLLTVGHSNHPPERFLALLRGAGVTAVADVRSQPYSRRLPHFNERELAELLRSAGIAYFFLGEALGGRPEDPDLYDLEGWADYRKVRATVTFRHGLDRLREIMEGHTVALLCSEADPLDCHRGLMIAPALVELGITPEHLRPDGTVETTGAMEQRLLNELKRANLSDSLFADQLTAADRRAELDDAYREMNRRKAFRIGRPPHEP